MRLLTVLVLLMLGHLTASAEVPPVPTKRVQADMGPGCNFTMQLPMADISRVGGDSTLALGDFKVGPLPKSWKSSFESLYFGLSCWPANDPAVTEGMAKFNPQTGLWKKDLDRWFVFSEPTPEERKILDEATRLVNVQAVNSRGYVGIREDTIGDDGRRTREMFFCLFHPPKAICGDGWVGKLEDGRKGDLTPHALKIIRSIEFLPDEPQAQPAEIPAPSPEPKSDVNP